MSGTTSFLLPIKGTVNGRLITGGFVLTLSLDHSFVALRASFGVGGVGSGAMNTLEVGADEVLVEDFLISVDSNTLEAGGVVEFLIVFCRAAVQAANFTVGVGPSKLKAARAHVEVLLLFPGFARDWLAKEEKLGVTDHLGDSTIGVLEEDGDGPKLIFGEDVCCWVSRPAGGEFEPKVLQDLIFLEGSEDFTASWLKPPSSPSFSGRAEGRAHAMFRRNLRD